MTTTGNGQPSLRFSIVTVCLNSARTIRETLESIACQSWPNRELIVVDGVSSDETLDIVRAFPRDVSRIISEADAGIYDAMNKGVRAATGDIVYFLNSDDRLADTQVLADVAAAFVEDPGLELLFGDVTYKTASGPVYRSFQHISRHNLVYADLCHQAVFARRLLFERHGDFNLKYRINADYDWLLRVFRAGANTRHLARSVALFDASGRHSQDLDQLEKERIRVRLKFKSPAAYRFGSLVYRGLRRLRCPVSPRGRWIA